MLQFYFLSVLVNALAGYLLFFGEGSALEFKNDLPVRNEMFKLIVGIFAAGTGLFKILSPIAGDIPVLGDLVPAAAGLLCGFVLILEYYRNRSSIGVSEQTEKINRVFEGNKKIIGAAAMVAAVLHFFFPNVLLL